MADGFLGDVTPAIHEKLIEMVKKLKTNAVILQYMERDFNVSWSEATLKRRLRALGIRRHTDVSNHEIVEAVQAEMAGPSQNIGYRHMHQRLRLRHDLPVRRNEVYQVMKQLNPDRVQERRDRACRRRDYVSVGSNWIWHFDGHDKLKNYGFAIHAAIDGFSRKILWCHVDRTNNDPKYIAKYFYDFVKENKVIPSMTRSDAGSENGLVATCQMFLRRNGVDNLAGANSHQYGSSMNNQRIEAFWHNQRQHHSSYWEQTFEELTVDGILVRDNLLHKKCLQYVFMPLIRNELQQFVEEHNAHRIRRQRDRCSPQGIPEDLYSFPEQAGFRQAGFVPHPSDLDFIGEEHGLAEDLPHYLPLQLSQTASDFFDLPITIDNAKHAFTALVNYLKN